MAEFVYNVYNLSSCPRGTLYIGVTNSLLFRDGQFRVGGGGVFTQRHSVQQLVWYEPHNRIDEVVQREESLKRYLRDWNINRIDNPH